MSTEGVSPRDVRDLVREVELKCSARGTLLSPRSVYAIWSTIHNLFEDAVVEGLVARNPSKLKRHERPRKMDADAAWRDGAVFTRDELSLLLFDDRIELGRRVRYGLLALSGLRIGELAALTWSSYEPNESPLGKLLIAQSFSSKKHKVKSTKTGLVRRVPVHPVLAALLSDWREQGWRVLMGRKPQLGDILMPSSGGGRLNSKTALDGLYADLERLGLRKRRQHDLRRTFISLAQADGAFPHILKLVTHGKGGDIISQYTTIPWASLCTEVSKLHIERPRAKSCTVEEETGDDGLAS